MPDTSLKALITKIRRITARPSVNQISDASIVEYLNLFYEHDFPNHLKTFDFKTTFSFVTQPNIDLYLLYTASNVGYPGILGATNRNLYKSFEPPAYCSGYSMNYFQDRALFYSLWPQLSTSMIFGTSTGIAGPYAGMLSAVPVMRKDVLISVVGPAGNTLVAEDDGLGGFTGDVAAGGTINYITGAVSLTWNAIPPAGNQISARWTSYMASRPMCILFYNDYFVLRPIPDQVYRINLQAHMIPFSVNAVTDVASEYNVANPTNRPFLDEYFQLLAYGASLKILSDSLEMENYGVVLPLFKEQLAFVERKSLMQIKTQRASTIFSEDFNLGSNNSPTI